MRKKETVLKEIEKYENKKYERIKRGRTPGAGAGGFNRDLENINHRINLLRDELEKIRGVENEEA